MDIKMKDGPILMRNTMASEKQHASEFKEALISAVTFAREHPPQLMDLTPTLQR